ncbi:putative ribosome biogenesis GTPase RsgA [Pseudovibrio axinellae]|uniref:Small ribosomal subunit biogenesis GTPase RsgA n=1 Tax=Pseudovibrio axinellae TaxID=989403 RepID=A0A165ZAB1_9HYPH|nr:ribosome small subunit-dependent GTPase A [Pseudovibrio axinellae]KZL19649.1 putative ribosome biogenesis GTPase RsgA [Pseudovibrio axinellae]SEQ35493.1 ribosome biogenesis GTPase [Pseudovibrio axinellae]
MSHKLNELGWSAHFMMQLHEHELQTFPVARITQVHRNQLIGISNEGELSLSVTNHGSTGEYAVGDWVVFDEHLQVVRMLDRLTEVGRRAAGEDVRTQLIAANLDVLFITTSCNKDFNVARLERYLALAQQAGVQPVVLLTKADLVEDTRTYECEVQKIDRLLPVIALDTRDETQITPLFDWWKTGQTAALVGSSGVGKSTILNSLSGSSAKTAGIREDDARGRHTTTSRCLYPVGDGRWLMDTPGMRALRLHDASEGVSAVFQDLVELAGKCRFSDCSHGTEPGCAIQSAIQSGELDSGRLKRWQKLEREEQYNSETVAQSRARTKDFGKMIKRTHAGSRHMKGDY